MTGVRRAVNAVMGVLLALVLVVGVVQPAGAIGFGPHAEAKATTTPDPLLPDESADPKAPVSEVPEVGDFSNPPSDSTAIVPVPAPDPVAPPTLDTEDFDTSTAKVLSENEFERTYQGPGDTRMTEFSSVPLNVKIDGEWKPVTTDLSGRGPFALFGKGGAEVTQHPLAPVFGERADESPFGEWPPPWWPEWLLRK